jgi:hypothetical protein
MTAPIDPADFTAHTAPRAAEINERFKRLYDALDKAKMGLGPESFKDGAFTAAKFPAAQAWQTVALAGGFGFSPADLSYYKDQVGLVHFRPEGFTFTTNVAAAHRLPTGHADLHAVGAGGRGREGHAVRAGRHGRDGQDGRR